MNFREHQKETSLNGDRSIVRLKWLDNERAWMVTGYKEGNINSSADDRRRATHLAADYALDSFGGLKEVGAALEHAISRQVREYKQNMRMAQAGAKIMCRRSARGGKRPKGKGRPPAL